MEILQWVQQQYEQQCDGDWEHSYGIKIESLDNPGWIIKIDLEDTKLEGYSIDFNLIERSENDWYDIKIENISKQPNGSYVWIIQYKNVTDNNLQKLQETVLLLH